MLDIILGIGMAVSLGLGGYGMKLAIDARKAIEALETARAGMADAIARSDAKVTDLQSILTAAPPDMIAASVVATEWKAAMLALPEGSPKRQAYEARLKQLGAS